MEEKTFFEQGSVKVTNARFIVGSRTYAMNGVTSVKSSVVPPDRTGPIGAMIVGVIMVLALEDASKVLGILVIGLGVWLFNQKRPIRAVVLSSASGEAQALSDADDPNVDIDGVVRALNESIIHRG